jgi:hypothetical protein
MITDDEHQCWASKSGVIMIVGNGYLTAKGNFHINLGSDSNGRVPCLGESPITGILNVHRMNDDVNDFNKLHFMIPV